MKVIFASICFALVLCIGPIALGQGEKANPSPERQPIDWFYEAANYHSKTLLLKILQFTAPYPGHYNVTSLDGNGHAFTGRIVAANWFGAVKASENATLDAAQLNQVTQMLAQLHLPSAETRLEPQPGQLHTAFVFYDGIAYQRLNFNGEIPTQIDAILKIIQQELSAAEKLSEEQVIAHHRLMEETYGDWKNRNGLALPVNIRMRGFEGNRGLLLGLLGQRKTIPTPQPTAVSIYHALVFYPGGAVTGGGSGTNWSDDPVSIQGVTWTLPNKAGSFSEGTSQRELEIKHNAIDETVTIRGETYYLSRGNMFIIRMSRDWTPDITQLNDRLDQDASEQSVLVRFKSIMRNDASIQRLELYRQ